MPIVPPLFQTLAEWQRAYASGAVPEALLGALLTSLPADDPAWIGRVDAAGLRQRCAVLADRLGAAGGRIERLPLYGVPFAVKDNIDVAGLATTCACPEFAYRPERNATAVDRLEAAGAIVIGKTNLDQFATGLVGTRSPYGVVPNAFDARYIAGGSSSGSASVVARGFVPFALGTDTAGSGRVPAGHNNLVGVKPTRGLVSSAGMVPACRTLDCISVFALEVDDASAVLDAMSGFDAADPYSRRAPARAAPWPTRPVLGIPAAPDWFGDAEVEQVWQRALDRLAAQGVSFRAVDFTCLYETAALLYDGPWIAERHVALDALLARSPDAVHPVVRAIVEKAVRFSAVDAFKAEYRRAELARQAETLMVGLDGLLVPTAPSIYTIEAVLADPVGLNSRLGVYTNFVNLLDWSAIAVPAGLRGDGLPAGITLIAPAWQEARLFEFARAWQAARPWSRGASRVVPTAPTLQATPAMNASDAAMASVASPDPTTTPPPGTMPASPASVTVAVVGAHLSGMPLNGQLVERGATLLEATATSAAYRLYALPGTAPPKPGLVRTGHGAPIAVELWAMPIAHYGSFVALVPSPLGIGTIELADGRRVQGFLCEPWATEGARDITGLGGWRAFMRQPVPARG